METQPLFPLYYLHIHFHVNKAHLFLNVQGTILSSDFQQIGISGQIFVKVPVSNFTDILPVGTELLYAERRTDMAKLTGVYRS